MGSGSGPCPPRPAPCPCNALPSGPRPPTTSLTPISHQNIGYVKTLGDVSEYAAKGSVYKILRKS